MRLQEEVDLEVDTDGEMRRESFQSQLTEASEGFGEHTIDAPSGDWCDGARVGDKFVPGRSL